MHFIMSVPVLHNMRWKHINSSLQGAVPGVWTCRCPHRAGFLLLQAHKSLLLIGWNHQEANSTAASAGRSLSPEPPYALDCQRKYCACVFAANTGCASRSRRVYCRRCLVWKILNQSVTTAQRASVWAWLPISWSWSAMARAAGTRRTASAAGTMRTWVRSGSRRRREEGRRCKVPDNVTLPFRDFSPSLD